MQIMKLRKWIQIAAFVLMLIPVLWPINPVWLGSYISAQLAGVALTDPLAALEVSLAAKQIGWPLAWSVVPLLLSALLLGRIFCGWICPLNTLFELIYLIKSPRNSIVPNGWLPYRLLVVLLFVDWIMGVPLFTLLSPVGILNRGVAFGAGIELVVLLTIVAAEWFYRKKIWCRVICPAGALYGIVSRWRKLRIAAGTDGCEQCRCCADACTMNVKPGGTALLDQMACTNCGACIAACPRKKISFSWKKRQKRGSKCEHFEDAAG